MTPKSRPEAITAAGGWGAAAVPASITPAAASEHPWDVLVLGAGPAGSMAALAAAGHGLRVLLLDKLAFPREKVCGGCLNLRACHALRSVDLGDLPRREGGRPLRAISLHAGRWRAQLDLPGGFAIARPAMDAALVRAAVSRGASFLPETRVTRFAPRDPGPYALAAAGRRGLEVVTVADRYRLEASVVVVATGLSSGMNLTGLESIRSVPVQSARIGLGALVPLPSTARAFPDGQITMACGRSGYIGLAQVSNGLLDVAAAVDPMFVRWAGGAGRALASLLEGCGLEVPEGLEKASWKGTPRLTCSAAAVAAERVLLVGDSAGYVEPFTGEGMAWALESALLSAPLVAEGCRRWTPSIERCWEHRYRQFIATRRRTCHLITWTLRHEFLTKSLTAALGMAPRLARPVIAGLNRGLIQISA